MIIDVFGIVEDPDILDDLSCFPDSMLIYTKQRTRGNRVFEIEWDSCEVAFSENRNFEARLKGVYVNDIYGNGGIHRFHDVIRCYADGLTITNAIVYDGEETKKFL